MATINYICIEEFAEFHKVSTKLILEFAEFGLIQLDQEGEKTLIQMDKLDHCERAIRLHRDLGVNKEGIEIILGMRDKHIEMQHELARLNHQIKKYEEKMSKLFLENFIDIG